MPEMNAAELAKRLQQVEAALTRLRSRRAVRWSNALRRTQKRVATAPAELVSAAGQAIRRRGPV
jgi:ribosomal protein L29